MLKQKEINVSNIMSTGCLIKNYSQILQQIMLIKLVFLTQYTFNNY